MLRRRLWTLAREGVGTPLVLHPWELDEHQPKLLDAPMGHRFAHVAGLPGYAQRLSQALKGIRLEPLEAWIARQA
jgi:hypothetical protein